MTASPLTKVLNFNSLLAKLGKFLTSVFSSYYRYADLSLSLL